MFPSHFYAITLMNAPHGQGKGPGVGDLGPGRHSPVQLGVLHQRVGVPVTNEGPTREADEALRMVLQLPSHLAGVWGENPA